LTGATSRATEALSVLNHCDEVSPKTGGRMFKFELGQKVKVSISGEVGFVKGRAEYQHLQNQFFVHYKAADGRATDAWFDESELDTDF
jgi:hypothetical protein